MYDVSGLRYSRQTRLDEIGLDGQERLRQATVLVVGAGGLGSPALHHLAGAGVGTIGIVEFDRVDVTNLHRQTLYSNSDLGAKKIDAATSRLEDINPDVIFKPYEVKLDAFNADALLEDYDLVLDGSDTFTTRYAVNEASVRTRTPNIFASVSQFSGQASIFGTESGPCYRCLFPEQPPAGLIPNCEDGGVLGVVPSLMGTIQATEALKLILGIGNPLIGRLFMLDALDLTSREIAVQRDPQCRTCGSGAPITMETPVAEITAVELRDLQNTGSQPNLLDVRSETERAQDHIGGLHIPIDELESRVDEIDHLRGQDIVIYCASGGRSEQAARLLMDLGHSVRSLRGGMSTWIES